MPICSECRTESPGGKPFCGKCGAALPPETGPLPQAVPAVPARPSGRSRIELDPQLINSLLSMFVNTPGGTHAELQNGCLRVQQGGMSIVLDPIQLNEAVRMQLSSGAMGPFRLQVSQLQLGQNGLEMELRLL